MTDIKTPIVAIVGPPNAGKSTLLNKIAGRPLAVTSDVAGTTRDRQYANVEWNGKIFTLVDTAGLAMSVGNGLDRSLPELELNIQKQIQVALEEADAIILIVDGKQPSFALEQAVLHKFRKTLPRTGGTTGTGVKKPTILAVNKLDSPKNLEEKIAEFLRLGVKPVFPVSALTGRGIGDLLDCVAGVLPSNVGTDIIRPQEGKPMASPTGISVSIVGKPNVGKSSIFNKILNNERAVVSAMPGTTRTAVDEDMTIDGVDYKFIDTAGLKKKEFRQAQPDVFSGFQTFKSIRRSDVCLFVIDASEEITKQDQRVAAEIFSMDKGCVIIANKMDLLPSPPKIGGVSRVSGRGWYLGRGGIGKDRKDPSEQNNQYQNLQDKISVHFPFLWMCPVFFVSAITGEGLTDAIAAIKTIFDARNKTIDNQTLSEFLTRVMKKNPPRLLRDQKKPKVFSLHQVSTNPPTFELLVNHPATISMQFRKFLQNSIIKELDFWGTPVTLRLRGKDKA